METLSKPILFCDFDGTICHDRYWKSLLPDQYEKVQKLLFLNNKEHANGWMRGKYAAEEINKFVAEKVQISFEELWNLFVDDCKTMYVPQRVLERLSSLRDKYTTVLLTVNTDSFSRFTVPALSLDRYFDHISNSYHEKNHKSDAGGEIFLEYLQKFKAPIETSLVLDDSQNICDIFEKLGGTAYLITPQQDINYYLSHITRSKPIKYKVNQYP